MPQTTLKAVDAYDKALQLKAAQKKGKEGLVELDRWYRGTLRTAIQGRKPEMFLTQPELVRLVKWKLTRGSWRPKLLGYAEEQKEEDVVAASIDAFQHAGKGDMKKALESMMQLKGVGAATASAVLAAGMQDVPFMSDELLLEVVGAKKYTASAFAELVEKLGKKLADGKQTAEEYERQVWAAKYQVDKPAKREKSEDGAKAGNKCQRKT